MLKLLECDDPELEFISGRIFEISLPKDKLYLFRYFKKKVQRQFIKYFLTYGTITHFVDHTGIVVSKRWMHKLQSRLIRLEEARQKAKRDFDLEFITDIEIGKFKCPINPNLPQQADILRN